MIRARDARVLLTALLALSGCAAMNTYANERSDLSSGRTTQQIAAAKARQSEAVKTNAGLRDRLASLDAQETALTKDMEHSQAALQDLNTKLNQTQSATAAQRRQYHLLADKQRRLQAELDQLTAEPTPANAGDAAAKQLELDRLRLEKEQLGKQVQALQNAL